MSFKTEEEEKAEEFIKEIERVLRLQDDLIYDVESSVEKRNVLSPNTVFDRNAWVIVTLYNVSDPADAFPPDGWIRFGEIGADVDIHSPTRQNGYNPTIEFYKRIEG